MARRSNSKGGVLLMVLMVVIVLIAVVGPFAIAAWSLFNEARNRRFPYNGPSNSLVTADEHLALQRFDVELSRLQGLIDRVFARGQGLQRRADRMFDERSSKARILNDELHTLFDQQFSIEARKAELTDRIGGRIGGWLSAKSQLFGSRAALLTYVAVFGVIGFNSASSAAPATDVFAFSNPASDGTRIGASLIATLLASAVMAIGTLISRATLKQTF